MMVMLKALPFLWQGLLVTLQISAIVVAIAFGLGVLLRHGADLRAPLVGVAGASL